MINDYNDLITYETYLNRSANVLYPSIENSEIQTEMTQKIAKLIILK